MKKVMNQRYSLGLFLGLSLLLGACDNTTTNGPKNVVNQTTNTAPQVVNNTTIIQQVGASASPATASTQASAAHTGSPAPTANPSGTSTASCGKLNIQADGSWDFPRPDKTPRILKTGDYQLFQDGSAKITKAGEPDVGAIIKAPACNTGTATTSVINASPTPAANAQTACKFDIKADGSWNYPRPDKTPRILKKGEYQLFPDGAAKITKAGEPDFGKVVRPGC
ncbi:MAG: hypothetical protein IV090_07385 [Candidatus Sericytochromatia bacterium]|nr:hypothetical protein [Candidatus Sericytochromatia bacterium]